MICEQCALRFKCLSGGVKHKTHFTDDGIEVRVCEREEGVNIELDGDCYIEIWEKGKLTKTMSKYVDFIIWAEGRLFIMKPSSYLIDPNPTNLIQVIRIYKAF